MLILATYCKQHPHTMSFLRNKMLYSLLKTQQNTCSLVEWSVLNALNLGKRGIKIHNCALLLDFFALFCYTVCMPLFSRISPGKREITKTRKP